MRSQEFFAGWLLTQPGLRAGEVMYGYLVQFRWCKHFIGKRLELLLGTGIIRCFVVSAKSTVVSVVLLPLIVIELRAA
ncbi:hypothetical protein VNO80_02244 [Phaseolus coccineus]|uniref:Uncharacterized protein n=1 Tax=Phaseolus coccineus TaxID=3886 RepID=A0AAN9NQ15_PHACN